MLSRTDVRYAGLMPAHCFHRPNSMLELEFEDEAGMSGRPEVAVGAIAGAHQLELVLNLRVYVAL